MTDATTLRRAAFCQLAHAYIPYACGCRVRVTVCPPDTVAALVARYRTAPCPVCAEAVRSARQAESVARLHAANAARRRAG